jgi:hypothetical protein
MKYLKNWQLFESNWSKEEYIDEIRNALSEYNLSSVEVRELINRIDIESAVNSGEQPIVFIKKLVDELNLKSLGNSGFTSFRMPKNWQPELKYL